MNDVDASVVQILLRLAQNTFVSEHPKRIGVAVSGGSDSMAALHLMVQGAALSGGKVHAVTVDHGLRVGAKEEAFFVAETCAELGVPHDLVCWEHGQIAGNLQAAARIARYDLITNWAKDSGISLVVLGHTADDQAETVLMRMARSAGVDGLAGIRHSFEQDGVRFVRPFLTQARSDLQGYLRRNSVEWINDPSNDDARFDRVKARQLMALLSPLGINADTLSAVANNMAATKSAMDHYTLAEAEGLIRFQSGDVILQRHVSPTIPTEIERRLLIAALRWVSGNPYPPRQSALDNIQRAFFTAKTVTIAGCIVTLESADESQSQMLRITREENSVGNVKTATDQLWDGRWILTGPHAPDLHVQALGSHGLLQLPNWRESGMPRQSLLSSPSIWREKSLVAAPIARFFNTWSAKLEKSRDEFAVNLIRR